MSAPEMDDHESTDISDALISEAARLENEYRDQEATEPEPAPQVSGTEVSDLEINLKGESLESSQPAVISDADISTKSLVDVPAKPEASVTPEKRKVESSSLKRKASDDSLETIRPQPPDAKPLKKGFKIPKLSKQSSGASKSTPQDLTEEQRRFLAELERDFPHRYTDLDEDYKRASEAPFSPPLVENFFCPPKRQFNRPEGSSHYDRNNRNSSPYGHSPRYSQYPSKYSRDYPNSRDGRDGRDYPNNRDGRDYPSNRDGRDYPSNRDDRDGRDYPSNRDDRDGRDYPNSRHQHQRHQQRFQPY